MPESIASTFARQFAAEWRVANVLPSRWAGEVVYSPGRTTRARPQEHFQLICVLSGTLRVTGFGRKLDLPDSAIALLPPEWPHQRAASGRRACRTIVFQLELSHSGLVPRHPIYRLALPAVVPACVPPGVQASLDPVRRYASDPNSPDTLFATLRALHELLSAFLCEGFRTGILHEAVQIPDWLRDVRKLIDDGYRSGVRVIHLCNATGRSASSIQHEFRRHFGTTISHYIKRRRITLAQSLLAANQGLTITHLATRCGYRSRSLFQRHFKQITGQSPRDARCSPRPCDENATSVRHPAKSAPSRASAGGIVP